MGVQLRTGMVREHGERGRLELLVAIGSDWGGNWGNMDHGAMST